MSNEGVILQQLLSDTTADIHALTVRLLGEERSIRNFVTLMSRALETGNVLGARFQEIFPAEKPLACKAGCCVCCSNVNVVTQPAFAIYTLIFARNSGDGSAYAHAARQLGSNSPDCFFLRDNVCSIYPSRPAVCRSFHSFDLNECLNNRFLNIGTMEISGMLAVATGLRDGLKELSLDYRNINFNKALDLLMATEGVAEQWLAGGDIFAPCHIEEQNWVG